MDVSKTMLALFAAAGLCFASGVSAQAMTRDVPRTAATMSKEARDQAIKQAEDHYQADKDACKSLGGNARDVCMEEAKGREKVAKAEARAAFENTPKARESAREARADAAYDVAKEKCDDLAGNAKDVCVKEARAAHVKALADAKVDRVAADSTHKAVERTAEAKKDAAEDKRDAEYKVAVERCDSLAGAAKDTCVREAKSRYGRT